MTTIQAFVPMLFMFALPGCTHRQPTASSPAQSWPAYLSPDETRRFEQVAWEAAGSREMWDRFKPERMTTEPVKLDKGGIQFYLDQKRFDTVEVAIPAGGHVGWHSTYIGVTVARGTYEVLGMHESFRP